MADIKNEYQKIRLSNQELHQNQETHYGDIANDIFIQLTRLLISLNTFLLTFTSPIFFQVKEMSETEKNISVRSKCAKPGFAQAYFQLLRGDFGL